MTESTTPVRGTTPSASATPLASHSHLQDTSHAPSVPSPLNPAAATSSNKAVAKPVERSQREKKETLKKREASSAARGATPDVKSSSSKSKGGPSVPSPMRYSIPEPRQADYDAPRETLFVSHEPNPIYTPGGRVELKKAYDHPENKKAYRYSHCVADPSFHHKQYYRSSEVPPYGPRMSIEDTDRWYHFDDAATIVSNEKGWRMARANVFAREGSLYYEVKILKGVPAEGPVGQEKTPQPHIRMGWARREAPLDAPVGFDGYSYGVTDIRFETMHRSRAGKIALPVPKSKSKAARPKTANPPPVHENDNVRTGDVIGLLITLPSLSLHQKVIDGIYNPAVDSTDGFDDPISASTFDIIRDRIPVPFKGNLYFEQFEYQATKPMELYSDRGQYNKVTPHPNHEDVQLRSLPSSAIQVYKNGKLIGTAFEKLLAFLPPASLVPGGQGQGARSGFDDGTLGYYPAVAAFNGGMAQVNFGPDWFCPPEGLDLGGKREVDVSMGGTEEEETKDDAAQRRRARGIGERYKELIAEDVVWDLVDEVDFWAQDSLS